MTTPGRGWLAALLTGALGAACAAPPGPATETVKLSIGQAPVTSLDGLRIALVEIQDQRCPVDVNCVWAGHAKLTLDVSLPGAQAQHVVIGTVAPKAMGLPSDADLGPYRFSLVGLEPRPSQRAPVPPSSQVATVLVSRR
ncbi:MAG TPA: hypothetical protein VGQ91_14625 [Ideonella sp.]|jgi:hypothetical protein|nr:hypothetical protein [Ideonella sp.]